MGKIKVGIIGPGNIGTDLMYKVMRSKNLEMKTMTGIIESEGLKRAAGLGIETSLEGVKAVAEDSEIKIVFDATMASAHLQNAPILKAAGKIAIDMTPAAVGPYVVPCCNLDKLGYVDNYNMVTCGGQATIPIVNAINEVADVEYAEIVASLSSKSAGPGTRANIDEFTQTTKKGLEIIGHADKAKAIIILNPAEPPIMMCNTIYTKVKNPDEKAIIDAVNKRIKEVQAYVPGYKLRVPPIIDGDKVTCIIQVEGAGDFLPKFSGNLDIINSAAIAVAEKLADKMLDIQ
ncbi:MAG: acetaldehyde dehydrogenase (acetylating) [Clostridia bacterium]|jgi:acetaldehyde dehydrogenase|nr:acetaldehyde dehydrogenase (acetylating) [Clostridia bacterium]MCI1999226.1 acetaldehyde dehydrogenase (acetylating) [Clostridia bacterium]MCI2014821.1 acetaldehyde dehydrogenase (acetylating) [Clostridia bacterium]